MTESYHRLTIPELLLARATTTPERLALQVEGAENITFGEWDQRSNALAHELAGRGISRGDRVGLLYAERDWTDFAIATCAVHKVGGVIVPLSDRLAPAEVRHMLLDCEVSAILHGQGVEPPAVGRWRATAKDLGGGDTAPVAGGPRPDDLAQILYTSGTTGRPKGVGASHANLTFGCQIGPRRRKLAHSRHFLHAFPIGSNAGQTMLVNALETRPTALTLPRFTPGRFARLIESYRVGTVFVVPAMAIELLNAGVQDRHDLSSVRLLGSTAAGLPPAVAVRLAGAFPNATIVNYYTSTEAAPAQTVMVFDPDRPQSVGRPTSGSRLMIADAGGRRVPPGEIGEVWLRSPAGSRAYYRDRRLSEQVFRDGWVRMGDVGYLDHDGYLYLVDRDGDVIKSGAFKVSTLQVEAALYEHPAVAEAAVVGLPHPVLGMVAGAGVVTRSPVSATELRTFLLDRLAAHELPNRLVFLPALPKNHLGKVIKPEMRQLLTSPDA
ncbi:MAG TPA: AMP-binding protein [Streptosporangiaceae bacterium]